MSDSCNPMNCSPPGSSVHGLLQARILEWVAIFSSRAFYLDLPLNKEDIPWMMLRDQANIPGKFLPSSPFSLSLPPRLACHALPALSPGSVLQTSLPSDSVQTCRVIMGPNRRSHRGGRSRRCQHPESVCHPLHWSFGASLTRL